ncbi:MAG: restriction endonuclease subunit S, partial [Cyanobacteria bacterium MAG CAR4_bin_6]|nr:restriction endonuclease subunit S [Cyanobacteria bacterium MAG CAR4_bin_6]
IPALFVKMFGDPATNPMGWPKSKLGEICLRTEQCNPEKNSTQKFQYIDISGIDNVNKKINKFQVILGAEAPSRARKKIRTSDVLVSSVRPNLNAVAIVPDYLDDGIASTGFCVLRANREILDPTYLFSQICSTYFINTMVSKARGANYPTVSDKDIKDTLIPLPPLHIQNHFADIMEAMQATVTHIDLGGQTIASLRTSLMSYLFGVAT